MQTTFVLIQKYDNAKQVVDQLMDKNIGKERINVIAQKSAVESNWDVNERYIDIDVSKQFSGKKIEGLDAMLGREQPVRTNSEGDIYAAGELANIIADTIAAAGQSTGLKDALVDFGVKDQTAEQLADGVRQGELLLIVRYPDQADGMVNQILGSTGVTNQPKFTVSGEQQNE